MKLEELFLEEVKDIYNAEGQLVKALPKMAKAAVSDELKQAFKNHLEETKGQVERLKQVFQLLEKPPRGVLCKGMQGLVEEGQEHIEKDSGDTFGDLALVGAAERVEHYEIAAYRTTIAIATALKNNEVVSLLKENLAEEEKTATLLFRLSKPLLKEAALPEEEDEEEDELEDGEEEGDLEEEEEEEEV